jgi:hypothetical protein
MNCTVVEYSRFQLILTKKLIKKFCFKNKAQRRNQQNSTAKKIFKTIMNLQFKKKVKEMLIKVKFKAAENKLKNNNRTMK